MLSFALGHASNIARKRSARTTIAIDVNGMDRTRTLRARVEVATKTHESISQIAFDGLLQKALVVEC